MSEQPDDVVDETATDDIPEGEDDFEDEFEDEPDQSGQEEF